MKRSLILSTFRTEFRRKGSSYQLEISALRWVRKFLDEYTVDHSSQIRHWQIEYFISKLKKQDHSYDDLLQAQSALHFLMKRILNRTESDEIATNDSSGFIRITA